MDTAKRILVIFSLITGAAAALSWIGTVTVGAVHFWDQWEFISEVVTENALSEYESLKLKIDWLIEIHSEGDHYND